MRDAELIAAYHAELAAAFARGRLRLPGDMPAADAIRAGLAAGLRLHKFERGPLLPRVRAALGIVRGLAPASLLDIGAGRGTFLWPLLDALPELPVVAVERDPQRAADLGATRAGGIGRLLAVRGDVEHLPLGDGAVDIATVLEVLEHLERPERAAAELLRVARRAVVASVPAKPDANPQHIRLFSPAALEALFRAAGARSVRLSHVPNHSVAVATR